MPSTKLVVAFASLAALGACKKQEAPPAATGSASSEGPIAAKVTVTATGSAEAPAGSSVPAAAAPAGAHVDPGCKPGAYVHTKPDWCAELPADFKADPEDSVAGNTTLTFNASNGSYVTFAWSEDHDAKADVESVHAYAKPTPPVTSLANGDLPNGAGAFYHIKYQTGVEELGYLYTGKNADITCKFQSQKPEDIAKLEAICKTVKVP